MTAIASTLSATSGDLLAPGPTKELEELKWKRTHDCPRYTYDHDAKGNPLTANEPAGNRNTPALSYPVELRNLPDSAGGLPFGQYVDYDVLMERFRTFAAQMKCETQMQLDWTSRNRKTILDPILKATPGLFSCPLKSKHEEGVEELFDENFTDSFEGMWSEWTIQRERDWELTMPVMQAQLLGSSISVAKVVKLIVQA